LRSPGRNEPAATGKTNNDSTWFVGARAGWLMTPEVLNYWSVGYTETHFGGATLTSTVGAPGTAHLDSYDAGGWFLGGGLEVAMHGGWFWRSEVRYSDYSKDARAETAGGPPVFNLNFDPVVETATSEIVYKFNWGH
jgi:outer membrane immunogenic protein